MKKRSKNTMEHYSGMPSNDESMEIIGEALTDLLFIGIGVFILLHIGGIL